MSAAEPLRTICPRFSTETESATASATLTYCSTTITAQPVLGRDLPDRGEEALDDHWCETHAQLVDQEHLRSLDQRTRDGEHLLLAARQRTGVELPAFVAARGRARTSIRARSSPRCPATRRFSSTVSVVNSSRLSGTRTTSGPVALPLRRRFGERRRRLRSAPPCAGRSPARVNRSVVLPGAVRTEDRVDRARVDGRGRRRGTR